MVMSEELKQLKSELWSLERRYGEEAERQMIAGLPTMTSIYCGKSLGMTEVIKLIDQMQEEQNDE